MTWLALLLAVVFSGAARGAEQKPFVHPLFTDHAVMQRDVAFPVWGWTTPGAKVTVSFNGKSAEAAAGQDGKWQAKIGPFQAGGPFEMKIEGPQAATIKDVLVGDVWICSGQSNMEMGIAACNVPQEIAAANYSQIRLLSVAKAVEFAPVPTFRGKWDLCTPDTVKAGGWGGFSAAGYFFGRDLHKELKVPIGLIHTSWGGTIAEAWTSEEALAAMPEFKGRMEQVAALRQNPQAPRNNPNMTTVLYNGMIAPIVPFAIKGAIWYQGESNAWRAYQYRTLLPTMIKDWRNRFGVGDFPFYIVQLAAFQNTQAEPRQNDWAELREAQALTAKNVPNCGLAVAIDIGEADDIHPKNKWEVGKRLALCALAKEYGRNVEYSGPWYKSMEVTDKGVRLSFDHVGGGLVSKGGVPVGFAIAGEDRKFVWAHAAIEGDTILVSSPLVSKPVAVRYAWDINPLCNVFNKAGLPMVPFRTDEWPGVTVNNK